jgi:ATP-dependent Clp protease protease subunit
MRRAMEELNQLFDIIIDIYARHTKIPKDKLPEILDRDTFIRRDDAINWGLVDEIIKSTKTIKKEALNE